MRFADVRVRPHETAAAFYDWAKVPATDEDNCNHSETICDNCASEWLDDWDIEAIESGATEWVPLAELAPDDGWPIHVIPADDLASLRTRRRAYRTREHVRSPKFPKQGDPWTPEDEATLMAEVAKQTGWDAIGRMLGRNHRSVMQRYYVLKARES